jgi:hypothetical protein
MVAPPGTEGGESNAASTSGLAPARSGVADETTLDVTVWQFRGPNDERPVDLPPLDHRQAHPSRRWRPIPVAFWTGVDLAEGGFMAPAGRAHPAGGEVPAPG